MRKGLFSPAAPRFWSKVEKRKPEECWLWTGSKNAMGYGKLLVNGRLEYAHRFSITLDGRDASREQVVMHLCDNPPCVNPAHLSVGTQMDNLHDCRKKGRKRPVFLRGELNGNSKISADDVIAIRSSGLSNAELAAHYHMAPVTIAQIRRRYSWKHIS